jgi:hypothetical protein
MFGRSKFNALDPPPGALSEGGQEILRAVIVKSGNLHVSLVRAFDDPASWGLLLVDLARHAARIYATEGHLLEAEAMARIRAGFIAETENPTDLGTTSARTN